MVNNISEILDEKYNNYKKLPKRDYNMKTLDYTDLVRKVCMSWNTTVSREITDEDLNIRLEYIENVHYIPPDEKMEKFLNKYFDKKILKPEYSDFDYEKDIIKIFLKHYTKQDLLDYLGITPFTPSFMINIAPDWDKKLYSNKNYIERLTWIIEKYMAEGERFDRYSYVIENGADGHHIHAHVVAHINPRLLKSVLDGKNSHIRKGKTLDRLRYWAKAGGMEGIFGVKGKCYGLQTTILRNEELVNDKLDYLIEDRKPEGHKNKSVIGEGRVDRILFTVK